MTREKSLETGESWIVLTDDEVRMGFLAQCVEAAAEADSSDYAAMFGRLERADLTQNYILRFYDTLHTESIDNITRTLLSLLREREALTARS